MDENKEMYLKINKHKRENEYFIDRYGKIHKYGGDLNNEIISFHYEIAHYLYPDIKYPTDYLKKLGWIIIGSSGYSCPICDLEPSQSQINTLDKLELLKYLLVAREGCYKNYNTK